MNRLMIITILALVVPVILFAQINWTEHIVSDSFNVAASVHAIDLDDDGDIDVLGADRNADDITWCENDGGENFTEHTIQDNFDGAQSVFAIDLDNDGDVDVLGAANNADDITWWENDGNENFTEHTIQDNFDGAFSIFAIDLDNDGDVDVVGAANDADEVAWWENDGNENFTEHTIEDSLDGARSVFAIDIEPDGDIDVLAAAFFADDITWFENDGNENFTEHTINGDFEGACVVYAIDVNGDSAVDILGTAYFADDITWWENDGNENFTEHTIAGNYDGAHSLFAIDIDNDEDIDVLGGAGYLHEVTWWENDGNENFTEHTIDSTFVSITSVYGTDLNGDGDVDILAAGGDYIKWWASDLEDIYDVGPISIDIPSTIPEDTTFMPQATVKNFGTNTESFPVTCNIEPGAYMKTQTVHDLAPGDSTQITFSNQFTFESGTYTVIVYSRYSDDVNPANDTLEKIIETQEPGVAEEGSDVSESFEFRASSISRGKAHIELALPKATKVDLVVYDVAGRLTETLVSKRLSAGTHSISVSLDLPAGVYFYNLKTASGKNMVKKFLIVE